MRKNTLVLGSLVLLSTSFVHADERLFPSGLLRNGEMDISFSLERNTHSERFNWSGLAGNQSTHANKETMHLRYGLGGNWQIGMAIPYASQNTIRVDYDSPSVHYANDFKGAENPLLWATYGFIQDENSRFSLNGELAVTPDTTGKLTNGYSAKLISGYRSSKNLKLYSTLSRTEYKSANVSDKYTFSVGAFWKITESITLVPHAQLTSFESTRSLTAANRQAVGLSAIIQVDRNTYLTPYIDRYAHSSYESKDRVLHVDSTDNGKVIGLSLYHLF